MSSVAADSPQSGRKTANFVFLGPPGAGKGSLAAKFRSLNMEHVSSGEFFRAEAARGTPRGLAFARALEKGEFVSDELTLSVMRKWFFGRKNSRGFVLDGFPRNLLQAQALDEWLETRREVLSGCIYLELPLEVAVMRISERRVCPKDGMVYHLTFHPPQVQNRCDRCGGLLIQRSDDTEDTVLHRWRLFEENTLPLVDYYRNQGILLRFDGSKPLEQVEAEIHAALEDRDLT